MAIRSTSCTDQSKETQSFYCMSFVDYHANARNGITVERASKRNQCLRIVRVATFQYSRFQPTFHSKILKFVAKFGNSLPSSKVHFRIRKPVCELSICFVRKRSGAKSVANHSLFYPPAFEFGNELLNFATSFRTSLRSSKYSNKKFDEIDCNSCNVKKTRAFCDIQFLAVI